MPGRALPLVTNHYYHIYNRGVELRPTFTDKRDYQRFWTLLDYYRFSNFPLSFSKLKRLSQVEKSRLLNSIRKKGKTLTEVVCACLMPNHFHLLLRQNQDEGISQFLSNLQNSYTRYFNLKYERVGSLFQGKFKAVHVETEQQLLHLSRYIHLNPYSSAIVKNLDQLLSYLWSSLPQYLGNQHGFCQIEVVMSSFSKPKHYKRFLLDQADYQKQLEQIKHLFLE